MLDHPITQADVDNATKFENSDGDRGCVVIERARETQGGWVYKTSSGTTYIVHSDGTHAYGHPQFRLIARIKEPDMKQVVIEDRRTTTGGSPKEFQFLESGSICMRCTGGELYLVAGNERALQLTGADAGQFLNASPHVLCTPLPHLELVMALKERTT